MKKINAINRISIFSILFVILILTASCIPKAEVAGTPSVQDKTVNNATDGKATKVTATEAPKVNPEEAMKEAKKVINKETKKKNKTIVAETKTLDKFLYFDANISYEESKELYFDLNHCKLKGFYVEKDDQVEKGQLLAELDTTDLEFQITDKQLALDKLYLQYDTILNKAGTEAENSTALELLELDIEAVNMEIAHLEDLIGRARLVAPYKGIVTDVKEAEPGTMVRAYDRLMTIWNTKGIILESEILNPYGSSEKLDLSNIYTGMKVDLIFGGIHNRTYIPATITEIVSTDNGIQDNPNRILSDPTPFKLIIKPDGKDADKLSAGRETVLRLKTGTYSNVLVLPKTAVLGSDNDAVIKVIKGDKIINRKVTSGYIDRESGDVVITSGLLIGENVLLSR